MTDNEYDWMDEARIIAAQIWCDPEVEHKVMDVELAEVIANRIAFWMQTAAQHNRNEYYYRDLLIKCGEIIGDRAYLCDDGTKSQDVLCSKIPEIIDATYSDEIKTLRNELEKYKHIIQNIFENLEKENKLPAHMANFKLDVIYNCIAKAL